MMGLLETELHTTLLAYLAPMTVACVCALFCGLLLGSAWGTTEVQRVACDHSDPGDEGGDDDGPAPDGPEPLDNWQDPDDSDLRPELALPALVFTVPGPRRSGDGAGRLTRPCELVPAGRHHSGAGRIPCTRVLEAVARGRAA